jgi:hypothetical protein
MGGEILKRHETELNRFDYTILEFGGNDCDYNWAEVSRDPFASIYATPPFLSSGKIYGADRTCAEKWR